MTLPQKPVEVEVAAFLHPDPGKGVIIQAIHLDCPGSLREDGRSPMELKQLTVDKGKVVSSVATVYRCISCGAEQITKEHTTTPISIETRTSGNTKTGEVSH
jgi:hypothetical protein